MVKPKWPSKKLTHFEVPLFGGNVFVAYDVETYDQALDYLNIRSDMGRCCGQVMMLENTSQGHIIYMVGIFQDDINTVAHEATHIAQFVMEYVGSDDNETQAYLVGHFTALIVKHFPKEPENETKGS